MQNSSVPSIATRYYLDNPHFASDLRLLKLKLMVIKGDNQANELINKELAKRNYTSIEQWLIDRGSSLIGQLEQSEYHRKLGREKLVIQGDK